MIGTILSIERCSLHDGPGLRTTVFMKGCPLTCLWCHNPESQSFSRELYYFDEKCVKCGLCKDICANHNIVESNHEINRKDCNACGRCASICPNNAIEIKGNTMSVNEVMDIVLKDKRFYEKSDGGLTVSGGEPLAQFDFTYELLRLAKESGINTCVETSGHTPKDRLLSIVPYVDLFLYDFKESDDKTHRLFTGVSRSLIMDNLFDVDRAGAKSILRCPVIPTYNDRDEHFTAIADTANALNNITEINIMPYHPMGASKASRIGKDYPVPDIGFPDDAQVNGWLEAVSHKTAVLVKRG